MNVQAPDKAAGKGTPKPNATKPGTNPEKTINQLKQEIKTLSKTVKDMQQKPDTKAVIFLIPDKLLSKVNTYLSACERSTGITISFSELICDALDVYIWAEEGNKRLERERAESEKPKAK